MCRVQREKTWYSGQRGCILWPCQGQNGNPGQLKRNSQLVPDRLAEFLELAESAYLTYKTALPEEKRDLLKIVTSNRLVAGRSVAITLSSPFSEVANRFQNSHGGPYRDIPRTSERLLRNLTSLLTKGSDSFPRPAETYST